MHLLPTSSLTSPSLFHLPSLSCPTTYIEPVPIDLPADELPELIAQSSKATFSVAPRRGSIESHLLNSWRQPIGKTPPKKSPYVSVSTDDTKDWGQILQYCFAISPLSPSLFLFFFLPTFLSLYLSLSLSLTLSFAHLPSSPPLLIRSFTFSISFSVNHLPFLHVTFSPSFRPKTIQELDTEHEPGKRTLPRDFKLNDSSELTGETRTDALSPTLTQISLSPFPPDSACAPLSTSTASPNLASDTSLRESIDGGSQAQGISPRALSVSAQSLTIAQAEVRRATTGGGNSRRSTVTVTRKTVELVRDEGGYGIGIAGGYTQGEETAHTVFIKTIKEGSIAEKCGMLKVRDRVISINGVALEGMGHHEIVEIMKRSDKVVMVIDTKEGRRKGISNASGSEMSGNLSTTISVGALSSGDGSDMKSLRGETPRAAAVMLEDTHEKRSGNDVHVSRAQCHIPEIIAPGDEKDEHSKVRLESGVDPLLALYSFSISLHFLYIYIFSGITHSSSLLSTSSFLSLVLFFS